MTAPLSRAGNAANASTAPRLGNAFERTGALFSRVLSLSPEARLFFFATALVHALLKVLLGLNLVFEDRYGLRSMLAPPQSLVFAGGDIVVCFILSKLLSMTVPARFQRVVQALLFVPLWVFLVTNFIVHTYFKSFVNAGLLAFNGAGAVEITDYTLAGLTRYSLTFTALMTAVLALTIARFPELCARAIVHSRKASTTLLLLGVSGMAYVGTLSMGQSGFLAYNPLWELINSYRTASARAATQATKEESEAFATPKPMFGSYDTKLDVAVPSQRGKNVLFVLIESLPLEQTPLGGAKGGLTVLNELAQDGVSFTNFHTVFPATSRSFLTYHCGVYPTTGAATVTRYLPGYTCDSLLDGLKKRGYRTGFFTAPMFTYDNLHKAKLMKGYDEYEDFLTLRSEAKNSAFDAPAVEEEAVAKKVLEFARKDRNKPFFATYFMFWNHAPYRLPFSDISGLPAHERYQKTLTYLDGVLRNLLAELKKSGVLDDTLVVVAADHGEGFALHHGNKNHVGHIYEDDVRIPLVVHVPGLGKHESARLGSNVDFAPTMAKLLDLPEGASWQGQDLLSQGYEPRPLMLFGRASFATNGIIDGQYKYIEYLNNDSQMLFDLAADPHEQNNLATSAKDKVTAYRELLKRWLPVADYRAFAVSR
jgi:arylsulfatase A-like enzyme